MRIAFNPSTVAALTSPPKNKDITFDLRGRNIFARGVEFKGTDTNTWRDIKINNVSIGSNILDLRNGSNTTLTNTNGVVTINSTWRPVVDNLTSNSATSSLSANQGRVLKSLIDGKSDSGHNHDDRYLRLTGGTMLGALNFANNTWNKVGDDVYMGDHNIGGRLCIMGANGTTGLSFHKYGDASIRKSITFDGNTLYMNGSCDYATLSNQTNLLAMNTVPNKTAATSIGSWSPISGRYVFHQKWTDTSTGGDTADFGIYLDGNLTANMVLDGYYNSLLGFRVIGASGGFLKANGTIDNSTYLTSHQSLSNYYTKGEIDNQLGKYKLKSSIWVPETKVICSNFRDFLNKENLHKQAYEELNLYRFFAQGDESNYSSKYNYPVVDSHAMVFSIDGNNGYIRSMNFDLRSNNVYVTSRVANGEWRSWDRLLNTSDIAGLKNDVTLHQYLSNTDTAWYPLVWGGGYHNNTSDSTGAVYKSHDKLSWQTSSQTLHATNLYTGQLKTVGNHYYQFNSDATLRIYGSPHNSSTERVYFQAGIDNRIDDYDIPSYGGDQRHSIILNPRGGFVGIGDSNPTCRLSVGGDAKITGSIRNLAIGGGIYWNPYVESTDDNTDAASITLVKSGVAGGTTLVLSQQNDANDTIQFKTNGSAKLYHNSYPILTTQNTYVSNNKGYINGTEITQVNNANTLDGAHLIRYGNGTGIKQVYYFHTQGSNTSYIKLGTLNTVAVTGAGSSKVMFTVKGGINFGGTNESVYEVAASTRGSIQVTSTLVRGNRELKFGYVSTSSNVEIWMAYDGTFRGVTEVEVSSSVNFTLAMTETTTKPSGFVEGSYRILASTADNVASATNAYHLRINSANTWSTWYWAGQSGQPSWLWGSNDGTNMYVWNPSNFRVAYAASAGNSEALGGMPKNYGQSPFGTIPCVGGDGVMEIGRYIDYHYDNSGKYDFSTRLQSTGNYGNVVSLPSASGTLALTSQASSFDVNTAQYLRSLGNQNCQTGRTQAYGDVYTYNTYNGNTGSPTTYTSVIGFGRGIAGTVEIAGGWCNTNLYWRSLRDCCEDWYSWRIVLDSNNYTDFIGSYYWANVKISTTSSTSTSPTVSTLTATSSIRAGNIRLERTNEINSSDDLFLNYGSSSNISLCNGGGKVGIGNIRPTQKLDVRGNIITNGFGIQPYYLSKSVLLPTISPGDGYTYKCLEISATTEISCIMADGAGLMNERGILIKFNQGFDGQVILLKDLSHFGTGNNFFWVQPYGCRIIRADSSNILIGQNQISNTYDDGRSRFFVYASRYYAWIEFLCSNIS